MTNVDKIRRRLYKCYCDKLTWGRSGVSAAPSSKTLLMTSMYERMYAQRKRHLYYRFTSGRAPRKQISGLEHLERPTFKIARHLSRTKPKHWRLRVDAKAVTDAVWRLTRKLNALHIIEHRLLDYAERRAAMQ